MTYIADLSNGRSIFQKLEDYERVRIDHCGKLFNVYIIDDRKSHEKIVYKFVNCEKFTIVSDE